MSKKTPRRPAGQDHHRSDLIGCSRPESMVERVKHCLNSKKLMAIDISTRLVLQEWTSYLSHLYTVLLLN